MTKNPFINALAALLYIAIIASIMFYSPKMPGEVHSVIVVIVPIAMISLFTLSAAVMGYLFLSQPLQLYWSGEKKRGVTLFLQTLATFAVITAVMLILVFSGIFSSAR